MFHSTTNEILWSLNQMMGVTLSVAGETLDITDKVGNLVRSMPRGKTATLAGSNAFFDLGLFAAQSGTDKIVASAGSPIIAEMWESVDVPAGAGTITLKEVPVGTAGSEIPFIYALGGDETIGTRYSIAATASSTEFSLDAATKVLTPPVGLAAAGVARLFIPYEYSSEDAVSVMSTANDYPRAGRFVMEVLGSDVCQASTLFKAYVIFDNISLDTSFDINFSDPTVGHSFLFTVGQSYCDPEKRLFQIVIVEGE